MRLIKVQDIKQWPGNPREGSIPKIIASLRKFGYGRPIVLWQDDMAIAGNHTSRALQLMEKQQEDAPRNVQVIDGEWHVHVGELSHLDEITAEAYGIADNKTSDDSTNKPDVLATMLDQLRMHDHDLFLATGWDDDEFDGLVQSLGDFDDDLPDGDPVDFSESYTILIECTSEAEQLRRIAQIEKLGIECRALIS